MHSTEKSAVFSLEFSTSHDSWIFELIEIDIDIAQQLGALLWSTGNLGLQGGTPVLQDNEKHLFRKKSNLRVRNIESGIK